MSPKVVDSVPERTVTRLNELVRQWRESANVSDLDKAKAYEECADELESLLTDCDI